MNVRADWLKLREQSESLLTREQRWRVIRARAERLVARAGFDPDEPRDEHGEWTSGGGSDGNGDAGNGSSGDHEGGEPSVGVKQVHAMKPDFAKIAQAEYDAWEQDEHGEDPELGTGGICDRIASGIQSHLSGEDVATAAGGQPGDEHAWVIANLKEGVYSIDIPPHVYEEGGGYNWTKKPDVTIEPDDVQIDKIAEPMSDAEFSEQYSDY